MPTNTAAYLTAKGQPLEVKSAPYTEPQENEIVVKVRAIAMNPIDWGVQLLGDSLFPWINYPFIPGEDVAGEVVEVGKGVTPFKVCDRVLGHAVGTNARKTPQGFSHSRLVALRASSSCSSESVDGSLRPVSKGLLEPPVPVAISQVDWQDTSYMGRSNERRQ